jgi:hypothetical protein
LHAYSSYADIFVLKLNSSGDYQWHTFYGSDGSEEATDIAVDGSGNVYVTGWSTASWNGPTGQSPLNAFSTWDIFVLKLNSSGDYQWHTFYGSDSGDQAYSVAVDGSGTVYVTGYSETTWNGPASQSPLHAYSDLWDLFVVKLNSSGAYQWHTFYGSIENDEAHGIALDGSGTDRSISLACLQRL